MPAVLVSASFDSLVRLARLSTPPAELLSGVTSTANPFYGQFPPNRDIGEGDRTGRDVEAS
jgi:hypothetical protein